MRNFNGTGDSSASSSAPQGIGFSRLSSDIGSQEIIELYQSTQELDALESQADLYAIILATEHLERAYVRDAIGYQEYTTECLKLLSQFKLAERAALRAGNIPSTEEFMRLYQMDCPRATQRLLTMGVPERMRSSGDDGSHHYITVTVAETVQYFITAMDAVKLEQRAVDELQPYLIDLMDALTRLPDTPNEFEPQTKVDAWVQKLNSLRAVDEISEEDARQLAHDLEAAYAEFQRYLKRKK